MRIGAPADGGAAFRNRNFQSTSHTIVGSFMACAAFRNQSFLEVTEKLNEATSSRQRLDDSVHQIGVIERSLITGLCACNREKAGAERLR
jgi:hypothetical protein